MVFHVNKNHHFTTTQYLKNILIINTNKTIALEDKVRWG